MIFARFRIGMANFPAIVCMKPTTNFLRLPGQQPCREFQGLAQVPVFAKMIFIMLFPFRERISEPRGIAG